MSPEFQPGDVVTLDADNHQPRNGEFVAVLTSSKGWLLRRFEYLNQREGAYYFTAVNPQFPPLALPVQEVKKILFIHGVTRQLATAAEHSNVETLAPEKSERYREANLALVARLHGASGHEWSNVTLLHFLCETVNHHAPAIRKYILASAKAEDGSIALAEALSIARQVAGRAAWVGRAAAPAPTCSEYEKSPDCICPIELPGLAAHDPIHKVTHVLFMVAVGLQPYFQPISRKVIATAESPERALELAEALVIAEQVLHRDCCNTEIAQLEERMKDPDAIPPKTFLQRQAAELKLKVLLSGN
ncbi:MAG: hypothetical protein JWQ71_3732 [Pedosphaera sp.]|nr:hypothetical protein [Pedosphaera sp.]